jgi:hypothetical protein
MPEVNLKVRAMLESAIASSPAPHPNARRGTGFSWRNLFPLTGAAHSRQRKRTLQSSMAM